MIPEIDRPCDACMGAFGDQLSSAITDGVALFCAHRRVSLYATVIEGVIVGWHIKPCETPQAARAELDAIRTLIKAHGRDLSDRRH